VLRAGFDRWDENVRFAAVLEAQPRARILIEASTDSEWVARCLEALGHEVIVADPNDARPAGGGAAREGQTVAAGEGEGPSPLRVMTV